MVKTTYDGNEQSISQKGGALEAREQLTTDASLERFARSFEVSARRWELVVYPSLFAFILLAGYGFFLIYSLTQDMHVLAKNMDPQMSLHMSQMADHVAVLSVSIQLMGEEIEQMGKHVSEIKDEMQSMSTKMDTLNPMLVNMSEMNNAMHTMAANTSLMTRNTGMMTHEIGKMGRPMNVINSFFPW